MLGDVAKKRMNQSVAHIVARGFATADMTIEPSADDFKQSATFSAKLEHSWTDEKQIIKDAKGRRRKQEKGGK